MATLAEIYDIQTHLKAACSALFDDLAPVRFQDVPDASSLEPPYIGLSWSRSADIDRRYRLPSGLVVRDFFVGTMTLSVFTSRGVTDHNWLVSEVLGKLPDPDDLFSGALPLYRIADFMIDQVNFSVEGSEEDPLDRTDISIQLTLYVPPSSWPGN